MAKYKATLICTNFDEWKNYTQNIMEQYNKDISDNALLEEICKFNFKFETILQ